MSFARRYLNFTIFVAVMAVVALGLMPLIYGGRALLIGFDAGALVFLGLIIRKAMIEQSAALRAHAARNEPDHHVLNLLALLVVTVVIVAIWIELTGKGGGHGTGIALAAVTLALTWLFSNTLFALHYAHVYYLRDRHGKDVGGLDFPGTGTPPDYWDFAYFAFVLGMTFQVSDVAVTSKRMRRIALAHGLVAFVFNIAVVALSVNLLAAALVR